jgi:hypothetical protein
MKSEPPISLKAANSLGDLYSDSHDDFEQNYPKSRNYTLSTLHQRRCRENEGMVVMS